MSGDLSGFSMFELFQAEAVSHSAVLTDGLLALEADPTDVTHVDRLMRAAHSIKGAARIIDIDPLVELAHAMEDCFVAIQKGQEHVTSERVDQLLRGVDLMRQLAQLTESQVATWLDAMGPAARELAGTINQPVEPAESARPGGATTLPPKETRAETAVSGTAASSCKSDPVASEVPSSHPSSTVSSSALADDSAADSVTQAVPATPPGEDRVVPVDAENLNRIMRLASESMLESRRLQSLGRSLGAVRGVLRKIGGLLDQVAAGRVLELEISRDLQQLNQETARLLQEHASSLEQALWRSEKTSTALYHEVIGSRLRPFVEGTRAFPRMMRDLLRALGKKASLELLGEAVPVDRDILRKLEAPLNHLLRNCVDHGVEPPAERVAAGKPEQGKVLLAARHHAGMLTIEVRDDGRGIDMARLRQTIVDRRLTDESMAAQMTDDEVLEFLFLPGFSTARRVTEVSGRGVGLDVVRSMVQEVSGTVRVHTVPGRSTTFTLRLPVTLSVIRAALADIGGEPYAFPLSRLERIVRVSNEQIQPVQGRQQFLLDERSVGLIDAKEILELSAPSQRDETLSVIVLGRDELLCGLVVDRFLGEHDLVVQPLDSRLGKVPHISAAAVMESGDPLLILDIEDLFHSIQKRLGEGLLRGLTSLAPHAALSHQQILVVDDSITVREVERQLLAARGYKVDVAVDGQDGWHALQRGAYDLLITDVDMPRMNGIELIRRLRQDGRLGDLPVIIVSYKDRAEDRLLGLDVGANAYLTKGSFHDDSFVSTVADLIGEPTDAGCHRQ